ncbi:BA14K family protein [Jiella pelagia]|uniref:Lectin-like protein BA14k n=1 Tax=Jiella pelagia TaxID=2986949 RepID=A0ABY7BUX1_9HYPH|nr:BA14K family protein [Jiella pelagia]WAP67591.1 BA14K family protein [Jiella pelagia]
MNKIISVVLAAVLAVGTLGAGTVTASADPHWRGHHGGQHWGGRDRGPRWHRGDGRHWNRGHHRGRYYGRRHHNNGAAVGAGIAGLAIGAIVGGALANDRNYDRPVPLYRVRPGGGYGNHVARCEARYRSYDARSDTFLGYDGHRHRCNL